MREIAAFVLIVCCVLLFVAVKPAKTVDRQVVVEKPIIKEVPKIVEKQVIKEVPVYKEVPKIVEKEVVREVPVYRERVESPTIHNHYFNRIGERSWRCRYCGLVRVFRR